MQVQTPSVTTKGFILYTYNKNETWYLPQGIEKNTQ